jgi:hypothetical protein
VFDQDAALAERSRRALADRIVTDGIMVSGYHFPWPAAGTLARDGAGYVLTPTRA